MAATQAAPSTPEGQKFAELFARLTVKDADIAGGVAEVSNSIKSTGVAAFNAHGALAVIEAALADAKNAGARQAGLAAIASTMAAVGVTAEPYLVPLLPKVLELLSDKVTPVRNAAKDAMEAIVNNMSGHATAFVLPMLYEAMLSTKWMTKLGALQLLSVLSKAHSRQVAVNLPEIVPRVTDAMADARIQTKEAAEQAMLDACGNVGNRDIEPFVPTLVGCILVPAKVAECIHGLASTTFVQQVEAPTLSIIVPLLQRGLREPVTAIKRKSALIIENMAKLVDNPAEACPFLPLLLPGLERLKDEVADPECRNVAERAYKTLFQVGGEGLVKPLAKADATKLCEYLTSFAKANGATKVDPAALQYVAHLCASLCDTKNLEFDEWSAKAVVPYLVSGCTEEQAQAICRSFLAKCVEDIEAEAAKNRVDDDEEGEDLCNCEFSLAYGAKILLNNATMRLKRGKRYGLCGPNGVGKSTLMRAIVNGQVDGFPPKEQVRTAYVEHDIQGSDVEMSVVDFVFADPNMLGASKQEISDVLGSIGFTEEMKNAPINSLSGGWRMKLALARAMIMKADIMLLDEPTNHLDVGNVAWLENYLNTLQGVTCMIVSHDSGFLDHVCTHICHYANRKLKVHKGNLSEFVKQVPEAASYYSLEATTITFKLPEPGFLEGVKSKDRAILKMYNCSFKYPTADKFTFTGASVQCSMMSRVACIGANGAGKSTLIKVLTGETEPNEGQVWKHPNMRIAYVAQHAFHHIEKHLEMTPNEYIRWRYATGEDREAAQKQARQLTDEEKAKMEQAFVIDGIKRKVDKVIGRRKLKKDYEYDVQFVGMGPENNIWMDRDSLEQMGFEKMVNEVDAKEAARLGLIARPLTSANVQKHLEDVGLEAEFATHAQMRGLSGGQKVKVVIGAAMWNQPHLLVLDEPTNYLDRDSLGALAGAIREYGGGVVMISHHNEFTSALCPETWLVKDGVVTVTGAMHQMSGAPKLELKREETVTDALGNTIKVKGPKKELSRKEKKALEKLRKARRERGEEVTDSEEDE